MYYGWWMVILLFYTLIHTAGTHFYAFSVYVPRLIEEFDCTTSSLMLTAAAWSIVFGFSNPVIGSLVHRHGVRRIFITGVVLNGVLLLLMSFMTQLWHLLILNLLSGVTAASTLLVPSQTLITNWFRRRRGVAMALMLMGIGAGGFIVPQLIAWLIETVGWRQSFRIGSGINYLLVLPPLLLFLKDKPKSGDPLTEGGANSGGQTMAEQPPMGVSAREAIATPLFWLIVSVYVLQMFAISALNVNVQNFAEKQMGYTILTATHFMAFALLVTIPARFAFGWLSDRMDPKYLMSSASFFLVGSAAVLWYFVIELGWVNDYRAVAFFAAFQGLGIAGNAVVLPILVGRCFGEREFSKIIGMVMASFAISVLLGPAVMGRIYDNTGSYEIAFFVAMVVAGASGLLAPLLNTNALRRRFSVD